MKGENEYRYRFWYIGIDENSWYRPGIVSKPKKLVSPIKFANGEQIQVPDAEPGCKVVHLLVVE